MKMQGEHKLLEQLSLATGHKCRAEPNGEYDTTLVRLLTGESRELIDNYPEIEFFRDVVFYFKAFMAPTSEALPEVKPWLPMDAALEWSSKVEKMTVRGFGLELKCAAYTGRVEEKGFLSMFSRSKPRADPSLANPSNLAQEAIDTEEDVLHIRYPPEFDAGNRLSPRNCELLLQYLLVPYMRIPLVLQFFSDQMLLSCLTSLELQAMLDACLFEPGSWQAAWQKDMPEQIPPMNDDHFATPCGLLFNELLNEPTIVVDAIVRTHAILTTPCWPQLNVWMVLRGCQAILTAT